MRLKLRNDTIQFKSKNPHGGCSLLIISQLEKHKECYLVLAEGENCGPDQSGENWTGKFKEKQDVGELGRNPNICVSSSFNVFSIYYPTTCIWIQFSTVE